MKKADFGQVDTASVATQMTRKRSPGSSEIAELLAAVQKVCTAKGTPAITLLRVAA